MDSLQSLFGLSSHIGLVTGASSGLGVECAHALALAGADVVLVARRADRCEKLADELAKKYGVRALGIGADVAIEADIDRAIETARDKLGDVDILINNAGVSPTGRAENFKREAWDTALAVNLTAPMLLSQRVARRLIETRKPGRIINMVSIYAGVASSVYRLSAYCATKAGLANLTRQPRGRMGAAQHPGQCDRARMDSDRSDRGRHRKRRQQRAHGAVHADGTARPTGGIAWRGDFPCESRIELCYGDGPLGRWRLSILVIVRAQKTATCHSEVSAQRAAEESRMRLCIECHFSTRVPASRAPRVHGHHADAEVTIQSEPLPRFFSDALRACFRMTKERAPDSLEKDRAGNAF